MSALAAATLRLTGAEKALADLLPPAAPSPNAPTGPPPACDDPQHAHAHAHTHGPGGTSGPGGGGSCPTCGQVRAVGPPGNARERGGPLTSRHINPLIGALQVRLVGPPGNTSCVGRVAHIQARQPPPHVWPDPDQRCPTDARRGG